MAKIFQIDYDKIQKFYILNIISNKIAFTPIYDIGGSHSQMEVGFIRNVAKSFLNGNTVQQLFLIYQVAFTFCMWLGSKEFIHRQTRQNT